MRIVPTSKILCGFLICLGVSYLHASLEDDLKEFNKHAVYFKNFEKNLIDRKNESDEKLLASVARINLLREDVKKYARNSTPIRKEIEALSRGITAHSKLCEIACGMYNKVAAMAKALDDYEGNVEKLVGYANSISDLETLLDYLDRGFSQVGIDIGAATVNIFKFEAEDLEILAVAKDIGVILGNKDIKDFDDDDYKRVVRALEVKFGDCKAIMDRKLDENVLEFFLRDKLAEDDSVLLSSTFARNASPEVAFRRLYEIKRGVGNIIFKPSKNDDWAKIIRDILGAEKGNVLMNYVLELIA